jgi:subtilisin family serine protease/PKD repeat protein
MKLKYLVYPFQLLFFSFLSVCLHAQTIDKDYFDGEIYVKYNNDFAVDFSNEYVEPQRLIGLNQELVVEYGITQARFSFNKIPDIKLQRTVRIQFSELEKAETLIKYFEQLPYIEYAEKIPVVRPTYTPNDFGQNKNGDVWHLYKLKATKAWDFTKGDTNITVAVVDDEIDINHVDLKDNIWINPNEIPNNGIDDDNNGYIDDIHGWDVANNDNDPTYYQNLKLNHGTPCAGLVSASTDNGLGISAIGFNIKLIAIKGAPDNHNSNSIPNAYEGVLYATVAKADIISCSWGSRSSSNTNLNIINFATNQGSIVVASAGNENLSTLHYPAAYSDVISVTASEINDKKASFSNYGNWIDVSAPGVSVGTLNRNNGYRSFGGTSAACPITAGLLGLMKSYMPAIKNNDLKQCLVNSTDNIDNLNPNYMGQLGSGRINAEKALLCVDSIRKSPPSITISSNKNYICPLEKITLTATSYKRPLDSAIWYIYKRNGVEVKKGIWVEASFENDSIYSIAVVGYDKFGKDSVYHSQSIHVNSVYKHAFYFENFDNSTSDFLISNPDNGPTWQKVISPKAVQNNMGLKMDFYNSKTFGERDAFITPTINLAIAQNPYLTFHHSYSSPNFGDSLNIYASIDSGKTFPIKVYAVKLGQISTSSLVTNKAFIPSQTMQWCVLNQTKCQNISLNLLAGKRNVVLKFETYYEGGNNLYLDDIKVYTNCGEFISEKPISSFTSVDSFACINDSFSFSATSTSFPETYQWIFEGGTPDTAFGLNPKTIYTQAGKFDVTLITSNVLGSDTLHIEDYVTVVAPPKITVSDTQQYVCPKDSVFFTAWGADSIVWINRNTNKITIDSVLGDRPIQNTSYTAKAINKQGCIDSISVKAISVPLPPQVTVNQRIDTLEAVHSSGNFTYRWYFNDTLTTNFSTRAIRPNTEGNYKVEIIDSAGCSSISANLFLSTQSIDNVLGKNIKLYPNPVKNLLTISGLAEDYKTTTINISDILGRTVFTTKTIDESLTIDVGGFAKGIYTVQIIQGNHSTVKKILVE